MAIRIRLTDIAEHAGVSAATVSRVINGKQGVAEETRRAVISALDMLGYERPEKLRSRIAGLVGLIVPELTNPVFPAFAQHIEAALADQGYTPLLCTQAPGGVTEDQYIDILVDRKADGIIFISGMHADSMADTGRYERLTGLGVPYVFINGTNPALDVPSFAIHERGAMELAVRHLHSMGHRRIGLAVGQERYLAAHLKMEGFRAAMLRYCGAEQPPVVNTLFTMEGGHAAAGVLLDAGCTAIVTGSALMALGAIEQGRMRGLRVPEDLSVIGFDDSVLFGHTDPPLTTVRQPVESMCHSAASTLVSMIEGGNPPRIEVLFAPELIVRASTGPVPGGRRPEAAA